MGFRKQLKEVKRVVVKVGTSTLTYENGNINLTRIEKLTRILSDMINSGNEVVLVTSGAIKVKRKAQNYKRKTSSSSCRTM